MQKATVQSVSIKEGTSAKGKWINTLITTTDGSKVGTFEHSASQLQEGDEFEFEPELKGDRVDIKGGSFKLLKATASPASSNGGKHEYKRDTEGITHEYTLKARLQELKRQSIEEQVAAMEVGEGWRIGKFKDADSEVLGYRMWILQRLHPPVISKASVKEFVAIMGQLGHKSPVSITEWMETHGYPMKWDALTVKAQGEAVRKAKEELAATQEGQ
uniref:Uncharacterized protein n=1 Tax=viral metagenome TaxID=1070528 RepID=A0A6M3XRQ1_9ZZZZ